MTDLSTKDRILDAAEELIGRDGYAATSLRSVTTAAGVNLAAVHYHFGSKDVLVADLLDHLAERMAQGLDEALHAARFDSACFAR